ncbi:unnamed protein product [Auanema sp. JU1783]|nr:unnamed protein product [Auanema sp. JU1783]
MKLIDVMAKSFFHPEIPTKIKTEGVALSAAFMEDLTTEQNLLLIGGRQGIQVVDVETGMTFRKFDHSGGATAIRCRKGCMFQSTTIDGNVTLWDVRQNKPIELYGPVKRNNTKICVNAMDASEKYLVLAEAGGFLQINDLQSRKKLQNQKLQDNDIRSLNFSNSYRFLTSSDESSLFVHNLSEKLNTSPGSRHPHVEVKKVKTIVETSWHPTECLFVARGTDSVLRTYVPVFDENTI